MCLRLQWHHKLRKRSKMKVDLLIAWAWTHRERLSARGCPSYVATLFPFFGCVAEIAFWLLIFSFFGMAAVISASNCEFVAVSCVFSCGRTRFLTGRSTARRDVSCLASSLAYQPCCTRLRTVESAPWFIFPFFIGVAVCWPEELPTINVQNMTRYADSYSWRMLSIRELTWCLDLHRFYTKWAFPFFRF